MEMKDAKVLGAALPRVDGPQKLTGQAMYAADHHLENMLYGYGVYSTISKGTITDIDTSAAKQMPGVVDVFHHNHFTDRIYKAPTSMKKGLKVDESRLPFEDNKVYYAGQMVAYVVADTFAKAREAALKIKVSYQEDSNPVSSINQARAAGVEVQEQKPVGKSRGDAETAFSNSAYTHEATYTTPVETHNPMEMHATTAYWENGRLVVYESTQGVTFSRNTIARVFGLVQENVVVKTPFLGSGFGGKLFSWPHCFATAAISRELGKPVHFMVPRAQMFTTTGHRSSTEQTLRMSADENGNFTSIAHHTLNSTSEIDTRVESAGVITPIFYKCPNVDVANNVIPLNTGSPASMRAPGAAPGLFASESAIDELAVAMNMDPLELRRKNYTDRDQTEDLPWSDINILEAYDKGAAKFGWDKRTPEPGSMRDGKDVLGWGVAACAWDAMKNPSKASVSFLSNGKVRVSCAIQDIGTGTYNVMAQAVAAATGVDVENVEVKIGDSDYVDGPLSGGSWATASVLPAVKDACENAIEELKSYAVMKNSPFADAKEDDLTFADGMLSDSNGTSIAFADILKSQKLASAEGEGSSDASMKEGFSSRVFGVHFVEVKWDPEIADLRVSRVVSAIDVGKIINHKTATNQVSGAVVMGIGMAMFEHTEYDERTGRPTNNNIAEYLMPVHADMPDELDVILLDKPDYNFSEVGAKGLGEIGITGLAAAVANAVYHATGKRIRDLPITIDKLI
ncbi:xanthine dehydrogenase family protein molybdopterin-binding subunit [Alteromonas confluentis]|nr:xanthine dehydrogenase family protein molybdopterin-binding subunit [Alteromonas confluentis]